ncbi:hypothetical protein KAI92_04450 [Candidatus Parcubacteria bacterium]|nr:hypothetical protein [Candidatus Parcubacteria bacterium]
MNKKYIKKIVGTSIISVFILSLTLVGYTYAQAQGKGDDNKAYKLSGKVTSENACGTLELDTDGDNVTFEINDKTTFTRGLSCGEIKNGDSVHIISKRNNNGVTDYIAKVVQKDNGAGYGRDW